MLVLQKEDVKLLELAKDVQAIVAGEDSIALRQLALMGGSPHGARPKVLVYYEAQTGAMSTMPMAGGQPWLVKFQAQNEHKEAARWKICMRNSHVTVAWICRPRTTSIWIEIWLDLASRASTWKMVCGYRSHLGRRLTRELPTTLVG